MAIVLYGSGRSRATRIEWALGELGLEFELREVKFSEGEHRSPEFLALNPAGKVPVLVDDGAAITECGAIGAWLGDRYGDGAFVPRAGTPARAQHDRWCYFAATELEQPLWTLAKHRFALPKDWRVPEVKATAVKEFARSAEVLAVGLGDKPWILGEVFTFADVMLAHTLHWAMAFEVPVPQESLQAYARRASERAAFPRR